VAIKKYGDDDGGRDAAPITYYGVVRLELVLVRAGVRRARPA
jgi:hypothetical protein